MPARLDDEALRNALAGLGDWTGDRTAIRRTVHLGGTQEVDEFLVELEAIARQMNHDPETAVTDNEVTVTMSTHSAGGVTELDVEYARRVNDLLAQSA
jgi:4a-hydroxytetrahydrobiopterin dehydratase